MEHTSSHRSADSDFTFNPTNKVVGIIDEASEAKAALGDLTAAGFNANKIEVLMGEEAAQGIDVIGESREVIVHVAPSTQKLPAYYDAPVIVRRVEQELLAGHYGIGVTAVKPEARERVRQILKHHGGHFINFYGQWVAEALEP